MTFYLVGIKGSAMSALAKILLDYGYKVTGCDYDEHFFTQDGLNVPIESFTNVELKENYYYIIGNAFCEHAVTYEIKEQKYHYDYFPHFIDTFFSKQMVCVAGTHGKTTTTALLTQLVPDVNYLIGDGNGFGNKNSKWFILEACEYRDTFLNYNPYISLILNIELDHPDYFKDINQVRESFQKFVDKSNITVINGDSENCVDFKGNLITFGLKETNDITFTYNDGEVTICDEKYLLPYKGLHYAYDFVGAYIVSKLMNTRSIDIEERVLDWKLPKRRLEKQIINNQIIVCDYAHHPTEIEALYQNLRAEYPDNEIIIIFEPHTYSRTEAFLNSYVHTLNQFNFCYIYDVFTSAREIYDVEREKSIYKRLLFERFKEYQFLKFRELNNIVLCFVGAGRIDKLYQKYLKFVNE